MRAESAPSTSALKDTRKDTVVRIRVGRRHGPDIGVLAMSSLKALALSAPVPRLSYCETRLRVSRDVMSG